MNGEPFLPSARQAMRYAVELSSNPTPAAIDLERARVWVAIAHELRLGETARPFPRPLDRPSSEPPPGVVPRVTHFGDDYLLPSCEQVSGDDPEGCIVSFNVPHVTCHDCLRIIKERELAAQIAREDTPVARHAEYEAGLREQLPEETAVLRYGPSGQSPLAKCGNCPHEIEMDLANVPAIWRHVITRQAVCPVSKADQAHTFATPLVDARG